ncbi:3-hydroxyacyl-CoA dehydrogenase PaaH [Buttiauxella selenatireducens]|uniref:3-hydroxyacyl-CoA dehydrogenase PaaH n=1 Tax=Buttiauxella selenatireducens TaxID=3073902 RepID=A0ABY9SKM5_9ENTR|nr:3-hydroxyacyl-CoA dehydrogenase PaaH [Buttiauxella sp. R73]WMY76537.1 3-hydroxyacyl-CoA dehydrogenase PaaH [Buttiauxella sp. R73]
MMLTPHSVIAVIGSGTMGAGIAQVAAQAGHQVRIYDIQPGAAARAIDGIATTLSARVTKGKLSETDKNATVNRLLAAQSISELADAALVIEAAAEQIDIKQAIFRELAAVCSPDTTFASNTSSISITAIASGVEHPQRVAGLHFFNPAPVMKLVEVVSGLETSPAVLESLTELALRWGKQPVRCHSTPGFIVNRVARPFYAEAWRALEEQIAPAGVIDAALRDCGGFPMGPLALTDLIGQDVNFAVTCSVFNGFWQERRFLPSLIQQELVLGKRLGKKTGQGVFSWPLNESLPYQAVQPVSAQAGHIQRHGRAAWLNNTDSCDSVTDSSLELDDVWVQVTQGETATQLAKRLQRPVVLLDLVNDWQRSPLVVLAAAAGNTPEQTAKVVRFFQQQGKQVLMLSDYPGMLVWRTVAMLANEASDALQKGVACEQDIDTAMRLGVNYPHGPLAWGAELGWQNVLRLLENLQQHYGEERYRPTSLLRQRALLETQHEH